jgi:hypothetical protein
MTSNPESADGRVRALADGHRIPLLGLGRALADQAFVWDNAVAESFFATLKKELIYPQVWPTRRSVRMAIFSFIEGWYNRARLHSTQLLEPDDVRGGLLSSQPSRLIVSFKSVRQSGATPA